MKKKKHLLEEHKVNDVKRGILSALENEDFIFYVISVSIHLMYRANQ